MAGDKGAEATKPLAEYLKKPAGGKLDQSTGDFYRTRGGKSPAMEEAMRNLRETVGRQRQSSEGDQTESSQGSQQSTSEVNPAESYADADRRNDETVAKRFGLGTSEDKTTQTEE